MVHLTATSNPNLPFRIADFETIAEGLDYAAKGQTGYCFFSTRGELAQALPYAEIRDRAVDLAHRLTASGLERGSRFAIIAETIPDFAVFFYGCQYAGLIPVPLPLITAGDLQPVVMSLGMQQLETAAHRAGLGLGGTVD